MKTSDVCMFFGKSLVLRFHQEETSEVMEMFGFRSKRKILLKVYRQYLTHLKISYLS